MSEADEQSPVVDADQPHALPAILAVAAYALVPVPLYDAAALAKFQEEIPTVALTKEECSFDQTPHLANEAQYKYDREELLIAALPQFAKHRAAIRHRIRELKELVPYAETMIPVNICEGWMGATAQQAAEINEQLLDLLRTFDKRGEQIEQSFQDAMAETKRQKAAAIMPDTLATVREALFQYEKDGLERGEESGDSVYNALLSAYGTKIREWCLPLLNTMTFRMACRFCGFEFANFKYTDEWPGRYCKSAHEKAFGEAWLRDHNTEENREWLAHGDGLFDEDERAYSVFKGDKYGLQCSECGGYFKPLAQVPKDFPAIKFKVCSWNCLVWAALSNTYYANRFSACESGDLSFIDPELSMGSDVWQAIMPVDFPPTSYAEVERRHARAEKAHEKQQPRRATARVINTMAALPEASATPMLVSTASMADRILSSLRELNGQVIEDRPLRKAAGVRVTEVKEYTKERDRLIRAGVIGRKGSGHRGSAFEFWYQGEPE